MDITEQRGPYSGRSAFLGHQNFKPQCPYFQVQDKKNISGGGDDDNRTSELIVNLAQLHDKT